MITLSPTLKLMPLTEASSSNHCSHCGQLVIGSRRKDSQGDLFCCEGCATIHGWLKTSKLEDYYSLMQQSGKKAPQAFIGEDYHGFLKSLSDPGILAGLGRWKNTKHDLVLECQEITCAGCGWLLERLLQGSKGVKTFDVDFIHGEAYLEYDSGEASLRDILSLPANFGYRLKPKHTGAPMRPLPDRALLYRLAVSGACFANAMAFSFALYLDAFKGMAAVWVHAFSLFGFLITIPAVGYAAFPFFSGAWSALKAGRFNIDVTVSIGILLSFGVTTLSLVQNRGLNFSDSLTGLIFFLLLGRWTVRRFEAGLALKGRWFDALRPGKIRVRRQGQLEWVDAKDTVEGEIIEILGGEYAPLDGCLDAGEAWMDTSLLTGESRARQFQTGDPIFAGYLNVKGRMAIRTHGNSASTRIANLGHQLDELVRGRRSLPDGVGKVAKWFTLTVIACGFITLGLHASEGWSRALAAAASVFIISCSCALALAAPISRGLGLKRAMALGFHFRAQTSLETLKDIKCILFDKTGTLTLTRRTVSAWVWDKSFGNKNPDYSEAVILQNLKALTKNSLHPVAVSLFQALESLPKGGWEWLDSKEIVHFGMLGKFVEKKLHAASRTHEICICKFGAWEDEQGAFASLNYPKPNWQSLISTPANEGLAGPLPDSAIFLDGQLIALVHFTDEIKPDVKGMVAELEKLGVKPVLLSGDNPEQVTGFAQACGFKEFHASLTPEAKSKWAEDYRKQFGPCLAVGDGFNDNLLFGASDMAMAVHGGAVDLSKATDILFTGSRPSDLLRLLKLSKQVKRSIALSFWVSGAYNLFAIASAMQGGVTPLFAAILMPISSISLCLVALLTISNPVHNEKLL